MKMIVRILIIIFLLIPFTARAENIFTLNIGANAGIPVSDRETFQAGMGAGAGLNWAFLPYLGVNLGGSFSIVPLAGVSSDVTFLEASFGPFFQWRFHDRFSLQAQGDVGIYNFRVDNKNDTRLRFGGSITGAYHLSPYISILAAGGYKYYAYPTGPFMQSLSLGVGVSLNLSEILGSKTRMSGEKAEQKMVFPASYAWYGDNPVGTVRITNEEATAITDVKVSFFLERYMSQPTQFASLPRLGAGETVELPITAFFNESMLDLTVNINANAIITIDYRSLGSRKTMELPVEMPIYHRNAMSWDDDRRASSFVSSRDPGAQYFARYMSSVLEKRMQPGIPRNIQYALGLFEALRIYGIAYIIDPASSYVAMSEDASIPDTLNYPYQTLFYRGGDCDDLSILYCSLLEVLNIDTAFITIPGHIYMAFDTGVDEDWAKKNSIAEDLILYDGKYWMPVEITVPAKGFYQAWQIGGLQWKAAGGKEAIFPMAESWKFYPPISVPEASTWTINLPEEKALITAFEEGMKIYERNSPQR
jgi:hypothetical protein